MRIVRLPLITKFGRYTATNGKRDSGQRETATGEVAQEDAEPSKTIEPKQSPNTLYGEVLTVAS